MKKIVIMPGGFHPFHAGHYALYQSAKKAFPDADMYVAASDSRTERPFPFQIKQKLAQVAGVKPNEFVQVKSPFRSEEITAKYNPNEDALIFVRSEKDKNEQPIPGGTKKDGTPSYFQPYNPKDVKPFKQHGYITYLPTVEFAGGIKSATEIRKQWPHLNDRQKANMIQTLYPETTGNKKLIKNVVGLMDAGMGMLAEAWSKKYKDSINCSNPKGFSQKAHCAGKKKRQTNEGNVVDLINPIDAEFINWLKDKPNLKLDMFSKDKKRFLRKLRLQYEKETGRKLPVNEGDVVQFKPREDKEIDLDTKLDLAMYIINIGKPEGNIIKNSLKQQGLRFAVDNEQDPETVIIRFPDGKTGRVKVDELREILIFHAYQQGNLGGDIDLDEDRYWNVGDGNNDPVGEPQQQPSEELRLKKTHQYAGAFVENMRHMIKTATNEEREKTLHLHRKAFELMEEEKSNVIKLRGFGPKEKEADKKVVDLQKVRQEKEQEQEKRNDLYDKKRKSQEHYMHVIQQILFGLHEEMAEMKQLGIMPIELIDTLEQVEELIGFIDDYKADDFPFTDDDGNLLETMYAKLSAIKEAWKNQKAHAFEAFRNDPILAPMPGGTVDTSDPKVLRPEEMKSERPIKFWRDLSEKVDYIEEK